MSASHQVLVAVEVFKCDRFNVPRLFIFEVNLALIASRFNITNDLIRLQKLLYFWSFVPTLVYLVHSLRLILFRSWIWLLLQFQIIG